MTISNEEARAARMDALVAYLKAKHGVDDAGLADLVGCDRDAFKRQMAKPWGKRSFELVARLGTLAGVSLDYLCAMGAYSLEVA